VENGALVANFEEDQQNDEE